jgi:hypothetical protein
VVVGDNGLWLDTSRDQEVHKSGLNLSLTRLEVISHHVHLVSLGKLLHTSDEGVLWGTINETATLQNGSHSIDD